MKKLYQRFSESKNITTWLFITLFFLGNWFSYGFFIRFDLSKTGRYRLTSATKKILRSLPEKVVMEAFFSTKVPDAYLQYIQQSRDFLSEYASASRGKIKISFIDPDSNESAKKHAQNLNIPQSQVTVQGEGDFQAKKIYLAVALFYEDKIEVINDTSNTRFLEYELTSKIYRMAHPQEKAIGYVSNQGFSVNEQNGMKSLSFLDESFKSFYGTLKPINTTEEEIPSNITTLLVVGPSSLSPMDMFRIDQFIMKGGNVIFTASGVQIDFTRGNVFPVSPEVIEFIKNYGFTLGTDMVFEPKKYIPFPRPFPGNPFLRHKIPYPVWVYSTQETLSQKNIMTKDVPGLFFPWASSITVNPDKLLPDDTQLKQEEKASDTKEKPDSAQLKQEEKASDTEEKPDSTQLKQEEKASDTEEKSEKKPSKNMMVLARTSPNAWNQSGQLIIAPDIMASMVDSSNKNRQQNKGTFNLIAYANARFSSYYRDKNKPPKEASTYFLKESEKKAKILLISTPFFVTNELAGLAERSNLANFPFILSALDSMNGLEELVGSRNKNVSEPMLPALKVEERNMWSIINFILPLLVIVVIGFVRLWKRNKLSAKVFSSVS